MIDPESLPIIVLGVERSGTSIVAEMLHKWGAYAGPSEKLHSADEHAPRGYWEFLPLWDLLAELGDFDAGATWSDHDFQQQMKKKAADPVYKKKATELMAEMHRGVVNVACAVSRSQGEKNSNGQTPSQRGRVVVSPRWTY